MIRLCNGEVFNVVMDENAAENMQFLFAGYGENIKIQIVDGNNKFVGMTGYQECRSDHVIDPTCVRLGPDLFEKARKIFFRYGKPYLPVVNAENELECFCYDCDLRWDFYNYQVLLMDAVTAKKVFDGCSLIHVWGMNEWSFYLVKALQNAHIPYRVSGEFWESCGVRSSEGMEAQAGDGSCYHFRSEGNQGICLGDLGFWENELPMNEYADPERRIQKLIESNEIFHNLPDDGPAAHEMLINAIENKIPLCVSRLGHTEAQIACCKENGFYDKSWLQWLYTTSGFFSDGETGKIVLSDVDAYVERTIEAIQNTDINMIFAPLATACLVNKYADPRVVNVSAEEMGAINSRSERLWTQALKGKKVLVVSSISETIKKQYQIKDLLHERPLLPDFELITLQTYETQLGNGCGFQNWTDAYLSLLNKVRETDFDVALISAGAYGYPLASDIKKMGKVSIELCSGLFPLFGVKMKRHDVQYRINRHWNEYWTYPIEQGPSDRHVIECGCYWRG